MLNCKTLDSIRGKSADELLSYYYTSESVPIDIVGIARKIGIKLGSIDFTKLESQRLFKDAVEKNGHILGAVCISDEKLRIVYHNSFYDGYCLENISEVDKKKRLMERQRFTIAHEIAHCCLHIGSERSHIEYQMGEFNLNDKKEREANIFAGELLIPLKLLETIMHSWFLKTVSISMLADLFLVPMHVMETRLNYLLKEKKYFSNIFFI